MSLVDAAAITTRLAQFVGAAVLCGGGLFFVYGVTPDQRARWPTRMIRLAAGLGALGTMGWLMAKAAEIGDAPADAFHPGTVWSVAADTGFGRVALARLGLFLLALVLSYGQRRGARLWLILALVGAAASASFVWTGHGVRDQGLVGLVHAAADMLHLLAAATWVGALAVMAVLAWIAGRPDAAHRAGQDALAGLVRFSAIGLGVVGVLTASGLVNSWLLIGAAGLGRVLTTAYGQTLVAKLVLFGLMLALAAANRYRITPQLQRALEGDAGARHFRPVLASILTETGLAVLVLGLVSWLGTLSPTIDG